jgi:hypothetical protein
MSRLIALLIVLVTAVALSSWQATPSRAATITTYYSGTLTENYHNFGACWSSIAYACTGWNYWIWNQMNVAQTNGTNIFCFDNNGQFCYGDVFGGTGSWWNTCNVGGSGMCVYNRANVGLYSASVTNFNFARACAGSECRDILP